MTVNKTLTGYGGSGYHTVAVVPAGARRIRIIKASTTQNVCIGEIFLMHIVQMYIIRNYLCTCMDIYM